jgi:hypothetical protein
MTDTSFSPSWTTFRVLTWDSFSFCLSWSLPAQTHLTANDSNSPYRAQILTCSSCRSSWYFFKANLPTTHPPNSFTRKKFAYLIAAFALSLDGGGVSSLSPLLFLPGKATGGMGVFLVSNLTETCSLLAVNPELAPLLACRKWVPESGVSRSMARLGGDCRCSSPEDREEEVALGAGLGAGRRKWLLQYDVTFDTALNGEDWRGSSSDFEERIGLTLDWDRRTGSKADFWYNPVSKLCLETTPTS